MPARGQSPGHCHGDRILYLGIGQRRGKHADLGSPRQGFCTVRFDDGQALLCLLGDCHPIPRRPPPDF